MNEELSEFDPVDEAAEEFVQRYRRGERPSLTEYVRKYPAVAGKIRALFPALVAMEELGRAEPASATAQADQEGAIPQQLGDYRIVREIARGGMGVVYEAVQQSLGRQVALKVLPYQGGISSNQLERFQREARAAARLHHTNIVPVFGVGEDKGIHYFAMQFIQGQSLDHVLEEVKRLRNRDDEPEAPTPGDQMTLATEVAGRLMTGRFRQRGSATEEAPSAECEARSADRGATGLDNAPSALDPAPSPPRSALRSPDSSGSTSTILSQPAGSYHRSVAQIGLQVAEALHYAHQQGVLHRDIKPSNLILDTKGTAWVTDFGLAKEGGAEELTRIGDIVGTLRYMAPERFRGQADARGDVYSLGLTLYEMVTLRPAFTASEKAQLIESILHEEPVGLRKLDGRVPRDLETIILKATAKEPARRYALAADMAEDLRRFLSDRPVQARRSQVLERAWRWCRRNPVVAALVASVFVLLLVIAIGSSVGVMQMQITLRDSEANRDRAERAERDAKEKLWQSYRDQARARRFSGGIGQRLDSLAALAKAAQLARELALPEERVLELRNQAIACLAFADLRLVQETMDWQGGVEGDCLADVDPPLLRYARRDRQGGVSIRRVADNGEVLHLPSPPGTRPDALQFSPDGRFLAVHSINKRIEVWHIDGGKPTLIVKDSSGWLAFAFSPDSKSFAVGRGDGTISLHNLAGPSRSLLPPGQRLQAGGPAERMAFHPGGRQLALSFVGDSAVKVFDLDSSKASRVFKHPTQVFNLTWHPNGQQLAVEGNDWDIYLWDTVAPTSKPRLLKGHTLGGIFLSFHPVHDVLASHGWDRTIRLWDTRTGTLLLVAAGEVVDSCLRFSRDGRLLAGAIRNGPLRVWELAGYREYRALSHAEFSPPVVFRSQTLRSDGRLLALGSDSGLGLWDLASGRLVDLLRARTVACACFQGKDSLLTNGPGGLLRWPICTMTQSAGHGGSAEDVTTLIIGPPEKLPLPGSDSNVAASDRGRLVVSAQRTGALVLHDHRPDAPIRLVPHDDVRYVATSPDGAWVATGSHLGSTETRVWETGSGRLVTVLESGRGAMAAFSPDGRFLAASGDAIHVWHTGSWAQGPRYPGSQLLPVAFSPDNRLLAFETGQGMIRLVDPTTAREYARLEDPNQAPADKINVAPDGKLIAASSQSNSIHVWNLNAIRQELAKIGLDWEPPGSLATEDKQQKPYRIIIHSGGIEPPLVWEAEELPVREWVGTELHAQKLPTPVWKGWSNETHLFLKTNQGGYVELELAWPKEGVYHLAVRLTKSWDYAVVDITLDGKELARHDAYSPELTRSDSLDLGTVHFGAVKHRLRFTAAGKNDKSTGYYVGVDCLELRR